MDLLLEEVDWRQGDVICAVGLGEYRHTSVIDKIRAMVCYPRTDRLTICGLLQPGLYLSGVVCICRATL